MCSTFLSYPVARRGLTIGFSASPKLGDNVIVVLDDPVDHLRLHAGHGGGVVVPLERAHLLVWLPARVASSSPTALVDTAPLQKRFPTRSLWRVAIGRAFGHSGGGRGVFCVGEIGLV
jgi:hypothetical protein